MVIKHNTPGCSTASDCGCNQCGCSGQAPDAFKIVFAGWSDHGDCIYCDDFNGARTLARYPDVTGPCYYVLNGLGLCGLFSQGALSVQLTVSDDAGSTVITIYVRYDADGYGNQNWIRYKKTFSAKVDCKSLADEPIPYDDHYVVPGQDDCEYEDAYGAIEDALVTAL
jgi:hypothetical protein